MHFINYTPFTVNNMLNAINWIPFYIVAKQTRKYYITSNRKFQRDGILQLREATVMAARNLTMADRIQWHGASKRYQIEWQTRQILMQKWCIFLNYICHQVHRSSLIATLGLNLGSFRASRSHLSRDLTAQNLFHYNIQPCLFTFSAVCKMKFSKKKV